MRLSISKMQKEDAMEEVKRMEVEDVDVGPKRKTRAPLVEVVKTLRLGRGPG